MPKRNVATEAEATGNTLYNYTTEGLVLYCNSGCHTEIHIMSTIGAFSTYGMDHVPLANSVTLRGHSCFRSLFYMILEHKQQSTAPSNQAPYENLTKKEQLGGVFAGVAKGIVMATAIYGLIKFGDLLSTCNTTKFDLDYTKLSIWH